MSDVLKSDPVIYVAPAEGLTLPLPDGKPWPAGGAWAERDEYVRRRLADGDLVLAEPPAEPAPTEPVPDAVGEPETTADAPAEAEAAAAAEPANKRRRS